MQTESTGSFVQSVRPLFKRRAVYRALTGLAFLVFLLGNDSWFFFPGLAILLFFGFRLADTETALARKVWKRFSEQLTSINETAQRTNSPPTIKGAIGSLGDSRYLSVLTQGTYGAYEIRLAEQTVYFNTKSKRGSYSRGYRVLEITTSQNFYHVFIDSKRNNRNWISTAMTVLSLSIRVNPKLSVEGDVNKYFDIFVPADDRFKSLVTLTPEKLLALRDYGTRFDVEFVDNKIYVITNDKIKSIKDILIYQESILDLVANIGVDVIRSRDDINNTLTVKTPTVLSL